MQMAGDELADSTNTHSLPSHSKGEVMLIRKFSNARSDLIIPAYTWETAQNDHFE